MPFLFPGCSLPSVLGRVLLRAAVLTVFPTRISWQLWDMHILIENEALKAERESFCPHDCMHRMSHEGCLILTLGEGSVIRGGEGVALWHLVQGIHGWECLSAPEPRKEKQGPRAPPRSSLPLLLPALSFLQLQGEVTQYLIDIEVFGVVS